MPDYNFTIAIRNKVPVLVDGPRNIVCDNSDYTVTLQPDEEWDGLETKTVIYAMPGRGSVLHVVNGNTDRIPIMETPGYLRIGVTAGSLHTTRDLEVHVVASIRDYAGAHIPDPTPDVYDKIMDELNTHETRLDELEQHGGGESGYVPPMVGATDSKDGSAGLVPAPAAGQQDAVLHGDGTWRKVSGGGGSVSAEIADGGMYLTTSMSVTISGGGMMIA